MFNRGRKRLTLTDSGKLFLDNVVPATENLRRAKTLVKDTAGPLTGNIVIASAYDIKQYYLPMLAAFAKSYKDVNLKILTRDNAEIPSLLSCGQADFGMVRMKPHLRSTERAGLEGCRYHHNFRLYRSKSHWQKKRKRLWKKMCFVFLYVK